MEVRRSKHGKACLVVHRSNVIVKYITSEAYGPIIALRERKDFDHEWPAVLTSPTVESAVVSYLCSAKRALRYNKEVVTFLWEIFMKQCSTEMSLAQLTSWYNSLAESIGKTPRKSFESKAAALAAIEKLDAQITAASPKQAAAQSVTQSRRNTMSEKDVEKKPRGKGIGARAMELILEGKTTQEVIDTIKAEIDGANPTSATIAWYKNKLRAEGKLPATNRKKKADAAAE